MREYDYVIYDTTFLLRRNISKVDLASTSLARVVIQSICKVIRTEVKKAGKVLLVWDTRPYHRTVMLDGKYKDNRRKYTEEDWKAAEDDDDTDLMEEIEAYLYQERREREATDYIRKGMQEFGFMSVHKQGYEADDLAYLLSCEIPKDKKVLLVSIDGDWIYNIKDNIDFLRLRKTGHELMDIDSMNNDKGYERVMSKVSYKEYGWFQEALDKGHNNMRRTLKSGVNLERYLNADIEERTNLLENVELATKQLNSFNYELFPDIEEAREMCRQAIKGGTLRDPEEFEQFSTFSGLCISRSYFEEVYKKLNPELYNIAESSH